MTPLQLSRARNRFPQFIQLLQKRGLTRYIVDNLDTNRMAISRWSRGLQVPNDELLTEVVRVAHDRLGSEVLCIYEKPEQRWAGFLKQASADNSLKALRKSRGLSQAELATALGVSRYTYLLVEQAEGGALAERARAYLTSQAKPNTDGTPNKAK